MKPFCASWLALVATVSCASAPVPVRTAGDIQRAEALPAGYAALGGARASCALTPAWGRLDGEPLTRFDCHEETLERALAEQAALHGGTLLVGMRCRQASEALACTATIAAPGEGSTPLAEPVAPVAPQDALSFETARAIEVDLDPALERFARSARSADDVGMPRTLPVSHRALGSLTVRCAQKDCDSEDLRVALRVTAGALGVSDVTEVACGVRRDDAFCVATLAASELDPETDPRAR